MSSKKLRARVMAAARALRAVQRCVAREERARRLREHLRTLPDETRKMPRRSGWIDGSEKPKALRGGAVASAARVSVATMGRFACGSQRAARRAAHEGRRYAPIGL